MWHQLYMTHCTKSDSCEGIAGFSLRARTPGSDSYCGFVKRFPALTRPDSLAGVIDQDKLPRQLALVQLPGGEVGMLHTNFLDRDTLNRTYNYFRHVVVGPQISLEDALRAWNSASWTTSYPESATQELNCLDAPPTSDVLTDDCLFAFLSEDSNVDSGHDLASVTIPPRLSSCDTRHELVRRVITELLAVCARSEKVAGPKRLYLHAEPGLVVLLLWCAAKLIPQDLLHQVTFATFVSSGSRLREFAETAVVGTYVSETGGQLEFPAADTVLIDTFEVPTARRGDISWIDALIASAQRGSESLASLHQFAGITGRIDAQTLQEACEVEDEHALVTGGPIDPSGHEPVLQDYLNAFRKLIASRIGTELLKHGHRYGNGCWKWLRKVCAADEQAVNDFRDILLREDQLEELRQEIDERLHSLNDGWWSRWQLLLKLVPKKKHWDEFTRLPIGRDQIQPSGMSLQSCSRLIDEVVRLGSNKGDILDDYIQLTIVANPAELPEIVDKMPSDAWRARAAGWNLVAARADRDQAIAFSRSVADLLEADKGDLGKPFCEWCSSLPPETQRDVVQRLAAADREKAISRLYWLFNHGLQEQLLPHLTVDDILLLHVDLDLAAEKLWQGGFPPLKRLVSCLSVGQGKRTVSDKVWRTLVGHIDKGVLLRRPEAVQRFKSLRSLRNTIGDQNLPPDVRRDLTDWATLEDQLSPLRQQFNNVLAAAGGFLVVALLVMIGWTTRAVLWQLMVPGSSQVQDENRELSHRAVTNFALSKRSG